LSAPHGRDILKTAFDATSDFCERVMALEDVPEARRGNLVSIVRQERLLLDSIWANKEGVKNA
jgi:hypothetical protein